MDSTRALPSASSTSVTASGRTSAWPRPCASEPSTSGTRQPSTVASPPATSAGSLLLSPTNSATKRVAGCE